MKLFDKQEINFLIGAGIEVTEVPFKLTIIFQFSICPGINKLFLTYSHKKIEALIKSSGEWFFNLV